MRRALRLPMRLLVGALTKSGWALLFLLLVPVSAVLHLDTPVARRAAAYVATEALGSALRGSFSIGAVRRIEPSFGSVAVELSEVVIRDPRGRRVIRAHRVVVRGARLVRPELIRDRRITIRLDAIEADGAAVHLIRRPDLLPTIVSAFEPRAAPSSDGGGPSVRVEMPSLRVRRGLVYGAPPGVERLHATDLDARAGMVVDDGVEITFGQTRFTTTSPFGRYRVAAHGLIRAGEAERRSRATARPIVGVEAPPVTDPPGAELDLHVTATAMDRPDRVRARLRLRGDALGIRVEDSVVTAGALEPFGIDVPIRGQTAVRGHLGGRFDAMGFDAVAITEGGRATVRGELPIGRPLRIEADVTDVDLSRVIEGAPESRITGRAVLSPGRRGLPLRIDVTTQRSRIAGLELPPIVATADVDPAGRRIHVQPAETRDPQLTARIEGTVGFDASVDLLLDADHVRIHALPLPASVDLPVLGGVASASLRVRFTPAAPDEGRADAWMSAGGRVRARALRVGPVTATTADYSGTVSGTPARPTIRGVVSASGVRVSELSVGSLRSRVVGGPDARGGTTFALDLDARGVTTRRELVAGAGAVSARVRVGIADDGVRLDANDLDVTIGEARWRGRIDDLFVGRRGDIVLGRALLAAGAQRIEATATRRGRRRIEGSIVAQSLDLTELLALAPVSIPLRRGRLDVSARTVWEGRFTRIEAQAGLSDAAVGRLENLATVLTVGYDGETVVFDTQTALETGGSVALGGRIDRALGERDLVRSFVNGAWGLEGHLDAVDLALVRAVWPAPTARTAARAEAAGAAPVPAEAVPIAAPAAAPETSGGDDGDAAEAAPSGPPDLRGTVTGTVRLSGSLEVPRGEASLEGDDVTFDGSPPAHVTLSATFEEGTAGARVVVTNATRSLAEAELRLPLDLEAVSREPERALEILRATDWVVVARLDPMSLEQLFAALPPAMRPELEEPIALRVLGELTARGPEERLSVDVAGRVEWTGEAEQVLLTSRPSARISGTYRDGEGSVRADVEVGSRAVLAATANAPLPLARWMRGERLSMPPFALAVTGDDVPASLFSPLQMGRLGGTFGVRAVASGLLGQPSARLLMHGRAMTLGGVPVGDFTLRAQASNNQARADLDLQAARAGRPRGRPGTQAHVEMPIRWRRGVAPAIRDGEPLLVSVQTRGQPIRPFAPFVPGVRDARGLLDGDAEYAGTLESGRWSGAVRLSRASVDLEAAGQRLDDVSAEVRFAGERVVLTEIVANDGGDEVRGAGELRMRGLSPRSGTMRARFDDFPIRNEGQILARLQGAANADFTFSEGELSAALVPRNLFVRLPDRPPGQLQGLEPNPDIHVVGEEPEEEDEGTAGYVYRIWFAGGDREIWVRRSDFSVRTVTDVRLRYDGRDLGMTGSIEITRGWVEMLGKRFEMDRGRIVFDNPDELDPALAITAQHEVAAASTTVTVEVGGRMTRPVITFSSNPPMGSESEVIALLVTGRGQDETTTSTSSGDSETGLRGQVEDQATNIVAGLTVGLVQSRVREEAPWLQVFTVDQSGEGRFRIRAGVPITPPAFLRGVVTNVFVQLQTEVDSTEQTTEQTAADPFSGILELTHPGNLRSTFSAGSTSGRFGVDFTWDVPIE
ncbi:MAG: translocation/assembly module TamB domain-containing protein [Deltaproteobacteria bacterium]|nr:translocation/assembly module TamB domain-containing protein [Deltaproteobacteria bacterium]